MKPNFSFIIPVYNEQNRIAGSLNKILQWIKENNFLDVNLIIVNDGSLDKTKDIVQNFKHTNKINIEIIDQEHIGQFQAILNGIYNCKSKYGFILEADLSAGTEYFNIMLKHLDSADVICGTRYSNQSKIYNKPIYRDIISKIFNFLFRIMFKIQITDPQFSFRVYNVEKFKLCSKEFVCQNDGMKSTELILNFAAMNFSIKEIPLNYNFIESTRNISKSSALKVVLDCAYNMFLIWSKFRKNYNDSNYINKVTRF